MPVFLRGIKAQPDRAADTTAEKIGMQQQYSRLTAGSIYPRSLQAYEHVRMMSAARPPGGHGLRIFPACRAPGRSA